MSHIILNAYGQKIFSTDAFEFQLVQKCNSCLQTKF